MPSAAETRRSVAGAERFMWRFIDIRVAGDALPLPERVEPWISAGEELGRVALVADVPDNLVLRGVEDIVQGDGKLHHPEVRPQVAALLRDSLDDRVPDFLRELPQLPLAQFPDVSRMQI